MIGPTGILVALIVLTIVLTAVLIVRPSITAGATGKILAFVALCILPALCIGGGMSTQMQRSEQTRFCISCHSMKNTGRVCMWTIPVIFLPSTFRTTACRRTRLVTAATPTTPLFLAR